MSSTVKKVRGVFERPPGSGVWWIQYFAGGQRHREKAGTRANAKELVEKRRTEALGGKKLPEKLRARAVTFQQIADAALEYSRSAKASYQNDEYRMARLTEQFGKRAAESILAEDFEGWMNAQAEERGWSVATKNRYTALLKLTYRLAEKNRKIKVNPARLLRMPKEDNEKVRYLNQYKPLPTKVEYLKDCATEEDRLRAVIRTDYPEHLPEFEVALATGMRRSEMYRATWPNVDLEHKVLTVPRSKHGETRHVTLNSTARAMLEFLREKTKASGSEHVFLSMRNNEPLTGNRHWFEDAVKKAGLKDFTWHCLRHSFGSRLASRGIDLRRIQALMGHKTLSMTVRYTHLSQPDLLAAVEDSPVPQTATSSATSTKGDPESSSIETEQVTRLQ
jgi:site-specific recombinase XerD